MHRNDSDVVIDSVFWRFKFPILLVKLLMIHEMDNKGAVDLANNWSIGGRTRHVYV